MIAKTHRTSHEKKVEAPPIDVFYLLANVSRWPTIFQPTVCAERVAGDDAEETIEIWASANGSLRNWQSRRSIDPLAMSIRFSQLNPSRPLDHMGGEWLIEAEGNGSHVTLLHDFRLNSSDPSDTDYVARAVETNSRAELEGLSLAAAAEEQGLFGSVTESVELDAPADEVFKFLNEAGSWSDRLPHVAWSKLSQLGGAGQYLEMATLAGEGKEHITGSYRVSFPEHRQMFYKQDILPGGLTSHTGSWHIRDTGKSTSQATSKHDFCISPNILDSIGLESAMRQVRTNFAKNSHTTLRAAAAHVVY